MEESGIDISKYQPENVDKYLDEDFDYVITVCGGAKESCPAFMGKVKKRLHIGFDDPAEASGSEDEIFFVFRRVRDEISNYQIKFNHNARFKRNKKNSSGKIY